MAIRVVPFSNGSESMDWYGANCGSCKTKCHYKRNIDMGFITGDITLKTAEFIGYETTEIQPKFVTLYSWCQNKDKVPKRKRNKNINHPKLF